MGIELFVKAATTSSGAPDFGELFSQGTPKSMNNEGSDQYNEVPLPRTQSQLDWAVLDALTSAAEQSLSSESIISPFGQHFSSGSSNAAVVVTSGQPHRGYSLPDDAPITGSESLPAATMDMPAPDQPCDSHLGLGNAVPGRHFHSKSMPITSRRPDVHMEDLDFPARYPSADRIPTELNTARGAAFLLPGRHGHTFNSVDLSSIPGCTPKWRRSSTPDLSRLISHDHPSTQTDIESDHPFSITHTVTTAGHHWKNAERSNDVLAQDPPAQPNDAAVLKDSGVLRQKADVHCVTNCVDTTSTAPTSWRQAARTGSSSCLGSSDILWECQAEGCRADVTRATKVLYRRHRLCDTCARKESLVVRGREVRFCQQCSTLHPLTEFDGHRRSCRTMLAKHLDMVRRRRAAARKAKQESKK